MMALFLPLLEDDEFWKTACSGEEFEQEKSENKACMLSDITYNHKPNSIYEYRIVFLRIPLVGWGNKKKQRNIMKDDTYVWM